MEDEDFEWDELKARINLRRHNISFQDARRVFDDLAVLIEQDFTEELRRGPLSRNRHD